MIEALQFELESVKGKMSSVEGAMKRLSRVVIIGTSISVLFALLKLVLPTPIQQSAPIIPAPVKEVQPTTNTAEGGSVRIGLARPGEDSQKTYLTTREVADKEGVSQRTVNAWIQASRIDPKPVQSDRAWQIAVDYRILPLTADSQP